MKAVEKTSVCCTFLLALTGWALATEDGNGFFAAEHRLYLNLTSQYQKEVRPALHPSDTVHVGFGLSLTRIHDLDERTQILSTNVWFRMLWKDPRLTWNPALYDDIKSVAIPSDKLWIPDITLYNMAHDESGHLELFRYHSVVDYNGTVVFVPHRRVESTCLLDMGHFPYDTHNCSLTFGSWAHHSGQVKLDFYGKIASLDVADFSQHSEWELINHDAVIHNKKYDCCPDTYQSISFSISIKRRNSYYTTVFVAPSVVLVFITPTVFWLPPDCSEKMTLGTGVMLGQVLLLVMLENFIPAAHPVVPVIARFYLFGLVMVALALILAVMVRNIWSQSERRKPVPGFLRTVVLKFLGSLLCVSATPWRPNPNSDAGGQTARQLEELSSENQDREYTEREPDTVDIINPTNSAADEWRRMAAIFDRLFFWLSLVFIVVVTISMRSS